MLKIVEVYGDGDPKGRLSLRKVYVWLRWLLFCPKDPVLDMLGYVEEPTMNIHEQFPFRCNQFQMFRNAKKRRPSQIAHVSFKGSLLAIPVST